MCANSLTVFLSYASPDRERVRPFFENLKQAQFDVWVDFDKIKVGQNWDLEILRGLNHADFILLFISRNSVDRRGYVQRELKIAIDRRMEKLAEDIFLLPVLLDDDVTVPMELRDIQHVRTSQHDCHEQIKSAINLQLDKLGTARRTIEAQHGLSWSISNLKESWDGLPGYEVAYQFIDVRSTRHGGMTEVGDYIKGHFLESLFSHRQSKFEQLPAAFTYGQDKFSRTNTTDAVCGAPSVVGNVLSIPYSIVWYGAGAAHSNQGFQIFNFLLNPVTLMPPIENMFQDGPAALGILQSEIRRQLFALTSESGAALLEQDWVLSGTNSWENLACYEFLNEGVRFYFAPYCVGAYALGTHTVIVPYETIGSLLKLDYVDALCIRYRVSTWESVLERKTN